MHVRCKVALAPGYNLAAWMRLSKGADLTSGVGLVDEDEDESTWKVWSLAELAKHNTAQDAWMAVRGKVYSITPYLPYHPGGVDTLLEAAGTDGTALFDKYHKWVNADGILAACCVGTLAKPGRTMATDGIGPSEQPESEAIEAWPRVKRIKWDEEGIKRHDAQRGVSFGTMKIDQLDTPFLYLDEGGNEYDGVAIHPAYLASHIPTANQRGAPRPHTMEVDALQKALGLSSLIERIRGIEMDVYGCAILAPRWTQSEAEGFGAQRQVRLAAMAAGLPHPCLTSFSSDSWQALYRNEARTVALTAGLPDGWSVTFSSSEPREPYYHHQESGTVQWDRPG